MVNKKNKKPIVLVIAGHDPSGGAGIQADIESIANAGCHATTVITSLTAQNTNSITTITPQDSISFREQMKLVLDDMDIHACKIGMIGSPELVDAIKVVDPRAREVIKDLIGRVEKLETHCFNTADPFE